jgi:predicted transcriptional regulator
MAESILEMAAGIVSSHASTTPLTSEELVLEIQKVHASLKALASGQSVAIPESEEITPAITVKQAFKKDEVICMICNKGKMKTLARHLKQVHNMKPGEYRKQFGIPSKQSLTAKSFSESRRQMAQDRGLADNLAKAREVRAAKLKEKKAVPAKPAKPKVEKKATPAKVAKPKASKKAALTKQAKPKAEKPTKATTEAA